MCLTRLIPVAHAATAGRRRYLGVRPLKVEVKVALAEAKEESDSGKLAGALGSGVPGRQKSRKVWAGELICLEDNCPGRGHGGCIPPIQRASIILSIHRSKNLMSEKPSSLRSQAEQVYNLTDQ